MEENFSFVSSRLASGCSWDLLRLNSDPWQVCRLPDPTLHSHTLIHTPTTRTHMLYIFTLEVLKLPWNKRLAKDLSTEKSQGNDILNSPVCSYVCLCECVCWHILVWTHSYFTCAQNAAGAAPLRPSSPPTTRQLLPRLICFTVKGLIKYLKYGVLSIGIRCNSLL